MSKLLEKKRLSAMIALAALLLGPGLSPPAIAAPDANKTITVDTTTDNNNFAYQACSNAANDCSLRGAISKANADASNTYTIVLPANTYTLTLAGTGEDNNATGDLDIFTTMTISGALPATTFIDANSIDRVIHVNGSITVWIKNVTIKNGRLPKSPAGPPGFNQGSPGGGILNNKAALKLEECIITNNRAGDGGAGLAGVPPNAGGNGGIGGDGGGIFSSTVGSLTLMDSVVKNNRSGNGGAGGKGSFVAGGPGTVGGVGGNGGSGGGINGLGAVTVINTLISDNITGNGGNGGTGGPPNAMGAPAGPGGVGGDGGEGAGIFSLSNLTMNDSVVDDNQTGDGGVGGAGGSSTAVIFGPPGPGGAGGIGGEGGGIYNLGIVATLDNSTISNNTTGDGGNGGTGGNGVFFIPFVFPAFPGGPGGNGGQGGGSYNSGTLNMTNLTVSGNTTGSGGSGGTGGNDVIGSGFPGGPGGNGGNGGDGGGVHNTGTTTNNNATITDNNTSGGGGGGASGSPGLAPSGVAGVGGNGGGVLISAGTVTILNTILADNTATSGPDCNGNLTSQDYNLVEDVTSCTIAGSLAGNITGQDPQLKALANYGGSTQTHALKPSSPAIDKANPAAPGSGGFACSGQDQRGIIRPIDGDWDGTAVCDIGTYEKQVLYYLPVLKK